MTRNHACEYTNKQEHIHTYTRTHVHTHTYTHACIVTQTHTQRKLCSNQEMFEESATCYLKALSLNPEAKHIWSSLRVVFNAQGRTDLASRLYACLYIYRIHACTCVCTLSHTQTHTRCTPPTHGYRRAWPFYMSEPENLTIHCHEPLLPLGATWKMLSYSATR